MAEGKTAKERVNIIFPREVLEELRRLVPRRGRSELVVAATQEKLARLRQQEAVRRAAGAWKDEDHPDLITEEDMERYLAEIRGRWRIEPQPDEEADVSP